jgi:membrane-anchored glycerophosphoryl diester phosphodiesterase (GDPDase)
VSIRTILVLVALIISGIGVGLHYFEDSTLELIMGSLLLVVVWGMWCIIREMASDSD